MDKFFYCRPVDLKGRIQTGDSIVFHESMYIARVCDEGIGLRHWSTKETPELFILGWFSLQTVAHVSIDSQSTKSDLVSALEMIRDLSKKWADEGRDRPPYWNLGDIANAVLRKLHAH